MKYELLVFDWDGTLMDSVAKIVACTQAAAHDLGLNVPEYDEAKQIIGLGLQEAMARLFDITDEDEVQKVAEQYRHHFLGDEPTQGGQINFAEGRDRIKDIGETYGMDLEPDTLVEALTVGERQRTEIVKVLYRGAKILILDEPTAVLVPQEVDELFDNLREMTSEGQTIIFISHHLDEVLAIADAITVMRGGRTVATVSPDDVDAKQLAELMVGSELPTPETTESTVTDIVELSVQGVTAMSSDDRKLLDDITFDIRQGEIVGIAGVEGNGQAELTDALMGIHEISSGSVMYKSDDIAEWSTKRRREEGIDPDNLMSSTATGKFGEGPAGSLSLVCRCASLAVRTGESDAIQVHGQIPDLRRGDCRGLPRPDAASSTVRAESFCVPSRR